MEIQRRESAELELRRQQRRESDEAERRRQHEEQEQRRRERQVRREREAQEAHIQQPERSSHAETQLNQSFDSDAVVSVILASQLVSSDQLDTGDKILLPTSVLGDLSSTRVAFPYVFRISLEGDDSKSTHARVAEFTAQPGVVVAGARVLCAIGARAGDLLRLTTVHLPDATRLRLRPRAASWIDIDEDERRVALSFALRNYATATINTPIVIDYSNVRWTFDVLDVAARSTPAIADDDADTDTNASAAATAPARTTSMSSAT
jgi:hypothetical protein